MPSVHDEIKKLPGFRISESHFRIGSKIHVSEFYYAKRFFQNSYFASRLGFIIAKEILEENADQLEVIKEQGLTLIGYGLYSEYFASLVERFLKRRLPLVNHDLVSDIDEPVLIKEYEPIHQFVSLI